MYTFGTFAARAKETNLWLSKELAGIRSGRAAPAILDGVLVESYGAKLPVKSVASVAVEDARTLRVTPFESALAKEIEKAITLANLGLSVSLDEGGVRVHFPALTVERRTALIRTAKEKFETARVSLRKHRDEVVKDIAAKEKGSGMGKDEAFRLKKELEKMVEAEQKKFEEMFGRKEKELTS